MARRLKEVRLAPDQIVTLAAIGCTDEEIATLAGVCESTIKRRFRAELDLGRANLRANIRRLQLQSAKKGYPAILIWLGKQYLGQRDRQDVSHSGEEIKIVERIVTDRADTGTG